MKKSFILILFCVLLLVNVGLGIYSFKINEELEQLKLNYNSISENNFDIDNEDSSLREIDCSFTRTYNIVDLMDGYVAEVPEYSYVIVDQFQSHGAIVHFIPTKLKNSLIVGESYEFTYHLKGSMNTLELLDMYDVMNMIVEEHPDNGALTATLEISKTDKTGLGQIQEPICAILE